jgi:hypothetical protein
MICSLQHGKIIACKHGAAALKLVQDPDAIAVAVAQAKHQKMERDEKHRLQDVQLPGEHECNDYRLKQLSAESVVNHLTSIAHSVDGLRQLAALFTERVMPKPSVRHCIRCDMDYDPQYCSKLACKVSHPEAVVSQCWIGSKKSWDECRQCRNTFNCCGMHGFVDDEGPWCFKGEHTPDQAVVKEEGWDEDNGNDDDKGGDEDNDEDNDEENDDDNDKDDCGHLSVANDS